MSALDGLQERIDDFREAGTQIIAVSPDPPGKNLEVVRKLDLQFPILSDSDLALTKTLGLVHEGGSPPPDFADIPRPAVFIVRDGSIQWSFLTDNYRIRARPETLLDALARAGRG